ncbi:MAG: GtrA family protein [Aquabacterium sp.]|nr:GtrA family protein [Aquabacterium sp.]
MQRIRSLAFFVVSGCLALLVDMGVLHLCRPWMGDYVGRAASFLAAVIFTWLFNRNITFSGPKSGNLLTEFLTYLSSMMVGGAINYGVYALSLHSIDAVRAQPELGVVIGSLFSMVFNYLSTKRILMQRKS